MIMSHFPCQQQNDHMTTNQQNYYISNPLLYLSFNKIILPLQNYHVSIPCQQNYFFSNLPTKSLHLYFPDYQNYAPLIKLSLPHNQQRFYVPTPTVNKIMSINISIPGKAC